MNPETPNHNPVDEAAILQWTWKTPAMQAMAVAICKLALARGAAQEFSANDLPEFEHGGSGICGTIFLGLISNLVIARVGTFDGAGKFCPKIVLNAGGNKIGVYRLLSHARASALVRIHGAKAGPELKQAELING